MKKPKKLLYLVNKFSYSLMLIYIVCLVTYMIFVLRSMTINYDIALVSLINIVALLLSFLVAEEIKVYHAKYQLIPILFGFFLAAQLYKIPEGVDSKDLVIAQIAAVVGILSAFAASGISIYLNGIRKKVIADNQIQDNHLSK